ncbi:MAG TPA: DsbA family protein [Acidimicrobiales bacterium]|nr:DsbA family protein [Acidimicrobiales bacterium]
MEGLPELTAVVWSDYLCPWCYVGLSRTALLEQLGVRVTPLPYELHPELPAEGLPLASDRGRRLYARIAAECEAAGMELRKPTRLPNTRRALGTSEWVRIHAPDAHERLHRSLFRAAFVDALDIGDPDVVDELVAGAGADAAAARAAVDAGELDAPLAESRERAIDAGVSGTPAWLVADRLLIPGIQAPELFERMVTRLRARFAAGGGGVGHQRP